jgi:glutathionylspermidine synthase
MRRILCEKRKDWQSRVEKLGFTFHTDKDGKKYWNEGVYYSLTTDELQLLEDAVNSLHDLCLRAIPVILQSEELLRKMDIPDEFFPMIQKSWKEEHDTLIYGRFDLVFDRKGTVKMLEYNADTPTTLLEAACIQVDWRNSCNLLDDPNDPHGEEEESFIMETRLVDRWISLLPRIAGRTVYFSCVKNHEEDLATTRYMMSLAKKAGISCKEIFIEDISFDDNMQAFLDADGKVISVLWKLYPWEWIMTDEFAKHVHHLFIVEPAWKILLSNKNILPVLYSMLPNHENLLPAFFTKEKMLASGEKEYICKPVFGREGANIIIESPDVMYKSQDLGYTDNGYIYQSLCKTPTYNGRNAVIGGWVVRNESAGFSIREDTGPITTNTSLFVPHLISSS